ncbi:hypothetical protein AB0L14_28460 [Streptomyces sp. NPDC052727]|uniref:hypothetical protein n=1 Tax=Streptomyces sp. NPDC052727 TaxID=3154854 RepID=UPI003414D71A
MAAARPRTVIPARRSTAGDRGAFRRLAEQQWVSHDAAVTRALLRMPTLRSLDQETVRADLVAVHIYLTGAPGPLHHEELVRSLRAGEPDLLSYAACLTSGLSALPTYRGVAVRGGSDMAVIPEIGQALCDPAPFSALPLTHARARGIRYAIWSTTARRVGALLGANSGERSELVFAPGTHLRMLAARDDAAERILLLREIAPGADSESSAGGLSEEDTYALERLEQALDTHGFREDPARGWPERCAGPLG